MPKNMMGTARATGAMMADSADSTEVSDNELRIDLSDPSMSEAVADMEDGDERELLITVVQTTPGVYSINKIENAGEESEMESEDEEESSEPAEAPEEPKATSKTTPPWMRKKE